MARECVIAGSTDSGCWRWRNKGAVRQFKADMVSQVRAKAEKVREFLVRIEIFKMVFEYGGI